RGGSAHQPRERVGGGVAVARRDRAVGKRDLDGPARFAGPAPIPCRALEEDRPLPCAPDLACRIVAERPAAIARETAGADGAGFERFSRHRLDGIPPDLSDPTD